MATFLNALLLSRFNGLIVFLFVFTIVYAVLQKGNLLKNKNLNALIAFTFAFLSVLNPNIVKFIMYLVPWFFVVILVTLFLIIGFMLMGLEESKMKLALGSWGPFHTTFIGFVGFVIIIVLFEIYGGKGSSAAGQAAQGGAVSTVQVLVQPQVMALIFVFLTAAMAVFFLTSGPVQKS